MNKTQEIVVTKAFDEQPFSAQNDSNTKADAKVAQISDPVSLLLNGQNLSSVLTPES